MEVLLEKEGEVENWNDDRLDEFSRRVDKNFEETREEMRSGLKEMREGFARVDLRLDRLGDRIDRLFYIQLAFMASLVVGVLTDEI